MVDKGAFAYWSPEEREWRLVSNENPEQLLRLINHRFRDGDTFVWNAEKERFELVNLPEVLMNEREEILVKVEEVRQELDEKITEQGKTLSGSIDELKKRLDAPYLEACTDYCRMSSMGGEFRTMVISTAGGKDVDWMIDDRVPLPDWVEAKRVGDELVVNVKEYVVL